MAALDELTEQELRAGKSRSCSSCWTSQRHPSHRGSSARPRRMQSERTPSSGTCTNGRPAASACGANPSGRRTSGGSGRRNEQG